MNLMFDQVTNAPGSFICMSPFRLVLSVLYAVKVMEPGARRPAGGVVGGGSLSHSESRSVSARKISLSLCFSSPPPRKKGDVDFSSPERAPCRSSFGTLGSTVSLRRCFDI